MATNRTSEHAGKQAKGLEAGVNLAIFKVSLSATFSVGDRYYIGKIPHRAKITDVVFIPGPAWAQAGEMALGLNGNSLSHEALFPSDSYSLAIYSIRSLANGRAILGNVGLQATSLSDERIIRFSDVVMSFGLTAGVGGSVGHVADVVVSYVLDDGGA